MWIDRVLPIRGIYGIVRLRLALPDWIMVIKRLITAGTLFAFLLVTGMAHLCPCTCCDATPEETLAGVSSPVLASGCCTEAESGTASSKPAAQDVRSHPKVSTCSCDTTPPTRVSAAINTDSHAFSKHLVRLEVFHAAVHQHAETQATLLAPAHDLRAQTAPYLSNCTFLC